ncbi:hypothetical protein [Sphingobium fluviale]|uniref:Uncharacterized protein n=1 Tax=Sphingobium fluviale TaxID=2506423 RepID=A0A4Q1KDX8_9SPHN|nr:hypothetical protein [Sphingobium fluviale]RXR26540.1 hypothetical protein EQG66_12580 [Sphingobium fluviale]
MNNRRIAPLAVLMLLGACESADVQQNLATLEAKVAHNAVDPALREALEASIATDPDLRREGNRDSLKPADKPLDGAVPVGLTVRDAQARALRLAGGKLLPTPPATKTVTTTGGAITLAGIAREQGLSAACEDPRLNYALGWANRLPAYLPLYPGAALKDAAGADDPKCTIRAATFATDTDVGPVLDFYYTLARRAGFSVEHVEQDGGHALKGARTKDGAAFHLALRSAPDGGVEGDLISSQRR